MLKDNLKTPKIFSFKVLTEKEQETLIENYWRHIPENNCRKSPSRSLARSLIYQLQKNITDEERNLLGMSLLK
ncbi:unnamed protein product [Didymodactylos carnosus]|uniref:Uncharacterized protein n=1 Tax=Didymodactylos carnosus TaxID=1234261 RepID=A0A8S2KDL0_9BILA|nr:unnamed protein product [Didymodactylos carnosus]CAF3848298.1 unnamed protein product [Didymodactylos carnosus]